jgi:hypothetical protein
MINIIKDIDPIELTKDYDVVMVGASINNSFLDGFQRKIGLKYPYVYKLYKKLPYGDRKRLGQNEYIEVYHKPIIALMHICAFPRKDYESIDWESIATIAMAGMDAAERAALIAQHTAKKTGNRVLRITAKGI